MIALLPRSDNPVWLLSMINLAQYFVLFAAIEFAVCGFLTRVEDRVVKANIAMAKALKLEEHPVSSAVEEFKDLSQDFRKSLGKARRFTGSRRTITGKLVQRVRAHQETSFKCTADALQGSSTTLPAADSPPASDSPLPSSSTTCAEPQEVQRRWLSDAEAPAADPHEGKTVRLDVPSENETSDRKLERRTDLAALTEEAAAKLTLEEAWHAKTLAAYGWAGRKLANANTGKLIIHDQDLVTCDDSTQDDTDEVATISSFFSHPFLPPSMSLLGPLWDVCRTWLHDGSSPSCTPLPLQFNIAKSR